MSDGAKMERNFSVTVANLIAVDKEASFCPLHFDLPLDDLQSRRRRHLGRFQRVCSYLDKGTIRCTAGYICH